MFSMSDEHEQSRGAQSHRNVLPQLPSKEVGAGEIDGGAVNGIQRYPLAAIAAALATGAVIAAAMPAGRGETKFFAAIARTTRRAASGAFSVAKAQGVQQLIGSRISTTAISTSLAGLIGAFLKRE
jgi:hypothetical protein